MPARTPYQVAASHLRRFAMPFVHFVHLAPLALVAALVAALPFLSWSCTCPDLLGELTNTCGVTSCPESGEVVCCPLGSPAPCGLEFGCRPITKCAEYVSPPEVKPVSECDTDADCPAPKEPRCAERQCVKGTCGFKVYAGKRLESQRPGDCKAVYCSIAGEATELEDPADVPKDGKECTFDTCASGKLVNDPYYNGMPCPESEAGVCVLGDCVACSKALALSCPDQLACDEIFCVDPLCADKIHNGDETAKDCGGHCLPCETNSSCNIDEDCLSKRCVGSVCLAPTNTDQIQNDGETGTDCGCPSCFKKCSDGERCNGSPDCASNLCYAGICQIPTCTDATKNGDETGEDCGGKCAPCAQP